MRNGKITAYGILKLLLGLLVVFSFSIGLDAQDTKSKKSKNTEKKTFYNGIYVKPEVKLTQAEQDSIKARRDSIHRADSIHKADSASLRQKSSLEMPAFTAAKDSIIEDFKEGKRMIYYYGDVTVTYDDMKLTADYMEYDLQTNVVYARGTLDTLSGTTKGMPVMTQGAKSYKMEQVHYNFKTRKCTIKNVVTNEADGILHGKTIKMMPDHSINVVNGKYTVCDCEHPHYYLQMSAAKIVTKPTQKTVFGPAWPVIADVPIPIGLPFGFIPKKPDRASGFLFPTFGEEVSRGFYIRDIGMYFVFGDYVDLSVTADFFTLGSWAIDINSRYTIKYKCNGNFAFSYAKDVTGEKDSPDYNATTNFAIKWAHSQDAKAHPGSTFSASVNFTSPSQSVYHSENVQQALQNQASSSISYSKNWSNKFNISVNALHSQNSRDSSYAFTLPNITFSVSRIYPFKNENRVGKKKAWEDISFAYNTTFQNKINFYAKEFDLSNPDFWNKMQNGMSHSFQIGLPSFSLFKYITVSPNISYGMNWFFRSTEKEAQYTYDELGKITKVDIVDVDSGVFGAFGITQTGSGSISANTKLYGMFNFGSHKKLQAMRHVMSPSISASFAPEQGTWQNGWRTLTYTDVDGTVKTYDYNLYSGQLNSVPSKGKTATMSFSLGNNLEAKVQNLRDTTGKGSKKIKLIDQLNLSTGYNFLADSLGMSNVGITFSTSVIGKIGINANLNFDPYAVNEKGVKYNKFAVEVGQGLLRLTNASASLSYSISGEGKGKRNDGSKYAPQGQPADAYTRIYYHPVTGEYIPGGWLYYMNPNSPWSLNFNYTFGYSRSYSYTNNQLLTNNNFTQTLGFSGNIKLTPRLAINMTSGIDLMTFKLSTTQISATYDLHCFNISVSWVPTGTWQSWSFRIAANAAALSDLLRYRKSSSYWDN